MLTDVAGLKCELDVMHYESIEELVSSRNGQTVAGNKLRNHDLVQGQFTTPRD